MQNNLCSKFIKSTLLATLSLSALTTTVQAAEESQEVTVVQTETSGSATSYFRRSDGSLWACGSASDGRLGGYRYNQYAPVMIEPSDVIDVSCAGVNTAYVKNDGSLWGTGANNYGQLGLDGYTNDYHKKSIIGPEMIVENGVVDVECGVGKTLFVKDDGSLWGMGINQNYIFSKEKSYEYKYAVYSSPMLLVESGVKSVYTKGSNSIYYITEDGSLWAFGDNRLGQITGNTKDDDDIWTPLQIFDAETSSFVINPEFHSILKGAEIRSAGSGSSSAPSSAYDSKYGTVIYGHYSHCSHHESAHPSEIISVKTTGSKTLMLDDEGTLWGIGTSSFGSFGPGEKARNENRRNCLEKIETNVIAMENTYYATFFIKDDNTLWAMGQNNYGMIGVESMLLAVNYETPHYVASNVKSVSSSGQNTTYITTDGKLFAMGHNTSGQLGDGTRTRRYSPVEITFE